MGEEGGEQQLAWAATSVLPVGEGWSELMGVWGTSRNSLTTAAHFVPGCLLSPAPHRPAALPPRPLPPGTVGPQSPCVLSHRLGGWLAVSSSSILGLLPAVFSSSVLGLLLLLIFSAPSQGTWQQAEASGVPRTGRWGSEGKVRPSSWSLNIRGSLALWHSSEHRGCL